MGVAHETVDLRLWDKDYSRWVQLAPWKTLELNHRADLSIDTLTVVLSEKHRCIPALREHRTVPVPVELRINGVVWTGLVTTLDQNSKGEVTVSASGDEKHLHRMLARNRVSVAVDSDATEITGKVGRVLCDLAAEGAGRTGLPLYTLVEHEGDLCRFEVKSEDTVASVVESALAASDTFLECRMLLPEHTIPGSGPVKRVWGPAEGGWEKHGMDSGLWPTTTSGRVSRQPVTPATTPTPHLSWSGIGTVDRYGTKTGQRAGVCWVPFMTGTTDRGYWIQQNEGARVASREDLLAAARVGWVEHITEWRAGRFHTEAEGKVLAEAVAARMVARTNGTVFTSVSAVKSYVGSGAAYAWWTGTTWVVANQTDFNTEDQRRKPPASNRVTPGILVRVFKGRDRKHIVFSSAPGGGLEEWATKTTAPEAAMIHATTQLDEATLQALGANLFTSVGRDIRSVQPSDRGALDSVIGSANGVTDVVEAIDVNSQPFATISGTDVSYSRLGGRVNVNAAGPFFYREMALNLGNTNANPVGELGREWSKAQGSTSVSLTPGYATHSVFGNDVTVGGRLVPGWKPGDRVSFVDGDTRVSEVVAGYQLKKPWDGPLEVTPVLGRADNGVMDTLVGRLRQAESDAQRALTSAPRRANEQELSVKVEEAVERSPALGDALKSLGEEMARTYVKATEIDAAMDANSNRMKNINRNLEGLNGFLDGETQNAINTMVADYLSLNTGQWGEQGHFNNLVTGFMLMSIAVGALHEQAIESRSTLIVSSFGQFRWNYDLRVAVWFSGNYLAVIKPPSDTTNATSMVVNPDGTMGVASTFSKEWRNYQVADFSEPAIREKLKPLTENKGGVDTVAGFLFPVDRTQTVLTFIDHMPWTSYNP